MVKECKYRHTNHLAEDDDYSIKDTFACGYYDSAVLTFKSHITAGGNSRLVRSIIIQSRQYL